MGAERHWLLRLVLLTNRSSDWAGTTQREAATKAKTSATRRSPLMWLIGEISRDQSAVCSRHWPPQQVENKRETVQSADSDLTSTSRSLSANKSNAKLQKLTIMRAWRGCSNPRSGGGGGPVRGNLAGVLLRYLLLVGQKPSTPHW